MKNYYEILEVDIKASAEVIEKAYRALVKKYHPDLQPPEKRREAEDKIKDINEAYDVLSNQAKKEQYDVELQREKEEEILRKYQERSNTQNAQNTYNSANTNNYNNNGYNAQNNEYQTNPTKRYTSSAPLRKQKRYSNNKKQIDNDFYDDQARKAYKKAYEDTYKAYNDAYIKALKNMGYEIEYEKTWKDYLRGFLVITFIIVLCYILWHIPSVKNMILDFCNNNEIIRTFIDSVKKAL